MLVNYWLTLFTGCAFTGLGCPGSRRYAGKRYFPCCGLGFDFCLCCRQSGLDFGMTLGIKRCSAHPSAFAEGRRGRGLVTLFGHQGLWR